MTTYYVRSAGSDAADGLSYANAWATLTFAEANTAAGDEVRVCSDFSISTYLDFASVAGTSSARIWWRGMNTTDGTTAEARTITLTSSAAGVFRFPSDSLGEYYVFEDLILDGNSNATYVINHSLSDTVEQNIFKRCKFTGGSSHGAFVRNNVWIFEDCEFYDNATYGLTTGSSRGWVRMHGCRIYDNGSHGLFLQTGPSNASWFLGCMIYRNGNDGIAFNTNLGSHTMVKNCTIYDNAGDGISSAGTVVIDIEITDNIIFGNGAYGQNHNATTSNSFNSRHNLHYNNTSGATNGAAVQHDEITSDPLLTDPDNGDFTPTSSSPAIGVGTGGRTIGAVEPAAGGGGGGTDSILGYATMAGGMQ